MPAPTFVLDGKIVIPVKGQLSFDDLLQRIHPEESRVRKLSAARRWLGMAGCAVDSVMAKRLDLEYRSGGRTGMQKVKHLRTGDCMVGGFRYASNARVVGSLLLGLYDANRKRLLAKLQPLVTPPAFTDRAPGGPSRWSTSRSAEWQPLAPRLVVEVRYDHFTGDRFRHGTRFLRWRPDKSPRQCTMDELRLGRRPPVFPDGGRVLASMGRRR